jgi:hypothetical protein
VIDPSLSGAVATIDLGRRVEFLDRSIPFSRRGEGSSPAMQHIGLFPDERQTVEDPGGRREAGIRIRVSALGCGECGRGSFRMGTEPAPVLAGRGDFVAACDLISRILEPAQLGVQLG